MISVNSASKKIHGTYCSLTEKLSVGYKHGAIECNEETRWVAVTTASAGVNINIV